MGCWPRCRLPSAASRLQIGRARGPMGRHDMTDWSEHYATRESRMRASEVRELLKLLDQPDIISFAGGIPDPRLFPQHAISQAYDRVLKDPVRAGMALQYAVSE